jgi:hypothetical protein
MMRFYCPVSSCVIDQEFCASVSSPLNSADDSLYHTGEMCKPGVSYYFEGFLSSSISSPFSFLFLSYNILDLKCKRFFIFIQPHCIYHNLSSSNNSDSHSKAHHLPWEICMTPLAGRVVSGSVVILI